MPTSVVGNGALLAFQFLVKLVADIKERERECVCVKLSWKIAAVLRVLNLLLYSNPSVTGHLHELLRKIFYFITFFFPRINALCLSVFPTYLLSPKC